jgi:hypothetical protein
MGSEKVVWVRRVADGSAAYLFRNHTKNVLEEHFLSHGDGVVDVEKANVEQRRLEEEEVHLTRKDTDGRKPQDAHEPVHVLDRVSLPDGKTGKAVSIVGDDDKAIVRVSGEGTLRSVSLFELDAQDGKPDR